MDDDGPERQREHLLSGGVRSSTRYRDSSGDCHGEAAGPQWRASAGIDRTYRADALSRAVETFEGVPVLRLTGKLVYGQTFQPLYDIVARLRGEGHHRVVIDLSAVQSTDSSGMSGLLARRRSCGGR